MYDKLVTAILKSEYIALISHISPDGDTLGSALALYRALKLMGKTPVLFCDSKIKSDYMSLLGADLYNTSKMKSFDLSIACDCGDSGRLGNCWDLFNNAEIRANIDHHKTNDKFADINIVEVNASANCEIMYKIIMELNKNIPCMDSDVAKLLYTGIVTDSGAFTFSSVTSQTHLIASELIKYNIDASLICEEYFKSISMEKFKLKVLVLSKAEFFNNNIIGLIHFTKDDFLSTNTNEDYTDGLINNIRNIKGCEIAISITETLDAPNSYKVSIRTSDNYDASIIAQQFGGGGHKNASGCKINDTYENAKKYLLEAARTLL